jgi:gluconolactonase
LFSSRSAIWLVAALLVFQAWAASSVAADAGSGPAAAGKNKAAFPTMGRIERFDPRLDRLVPRGAVLEKLGEGYLWAEGPIWIGQRGKTIHARAAMGGAAVGPPLAGLPGGCLLFSDIPNNTVMKWKDGEGISIFLKPSGYTGATPRSGEQGSNGLTLDAAGRLVLCQHGDRRIVRREADGRWTTLVDRYQGKRLNSPNDLVFKSNGDLYFTDPPYGLPRGADDPTRELDCFGVYRVSARDGKVTLLVKDMTRPNGIAFSPDEKTLYISQSDPQKAVWMAFPVKGDGTLGSGRLFYDATRWTKTLKGLPDGMKIDKAGNLFAAGPGGINVFSPDGTLLGRINPEEITANCAWGGDGSVLYIAAHQYLCRIKTSAKGDGF